jgi:hypothetical protein
MNATLLSTVNIERLAEVIADPDNRRNGFGIVRPGNCHRVGPGTEIPLLHEFSPQYGGFIVRTCRISLRQPKPDTAGGAAPLSDAEVV